jgi:hypothetical protein
MLVEDRLIDIGLPPSSVLWRRTASELPYPRLKRQMAVSCTDAHEEDFPLRPGNVEILYTSISPFVPSAFLLHFVHSEQLINYSGNHACCK